VWVHAVLELGMSRKVADERVLRQRYQALALVGRYPRCVASAEDALAKSRLICSEDNVLYSLGSTGNPLFDSATKGVTSPLVSMLHCSDPSVTLR
jgi:hypothetical protein